MGDHIAIAALLVQDVKSEKHEPESIFQSQCCLYRMSSQRDDFATTGLIGQDVELAVAKHDSLNIIMSMIETSDDPLTMNIKMIPIKMIF